MAAITRRTDEGPVCRSLFVGYSFRRSHVILCWGLTTPWATCPHFWPYYAVHCLLRSSWMSSEKKKNKTPSLAVVGIMMARRCSMRPLVAQMLASPAVGAQTEMQRSEVGFLHVRRGEKWGLEACEGYLPRFHISPGLSGNPRANLTQYRMMILAGSPEANLSPLATCVMWPLPPWATVRVKPCRTSPDCCDNSLGS